VTKEVIPVSALGKTNLDALVEKLYVLLAEDKKDMEESRQS
jgi:translation initiation factor 2 gamma subunit (eIF-2gamma)